MHPRSGHFECLGMKSTKQMQIAGMIQALNAQALRGNACIWGGNFTEAWVCPLSDGEYDAAIAQQGLAGRWLNYYIEGLRQSVAAAPHIDGIYFDGTCAFTLVTSGVCYSLLQHDAARLVRRFAIHDHFGVGYATIYASRMLLGS